MNFEAVPCMFTGRAEDGNQAQLFGLLIRPSAAATGTTPTADNNATPTITPLEAKPLTTDSNTTTLVPFVRPAPLTATATPLRSAIQPIQPISIASKMHTTIPALATTSARMGRGKMPSSHKKQKKLASAAGYSAASMVPISPKLAPATAGPGWPTNRLVQMPYCEPGCSTSAQVGLTVNNISVPTRWDVDGTPVLDPTTIGAVSTEYAPAVDSHIQQFPKFTTQQQQPMVQQPLLLAQQTVGSSIGLPGIVCSAPGSFTSVPFLTTGNSGGAGTRASSSGKRNTAKRRKSQNADSAKVPSAKTSPLKSLRKTETNSLLLSPQKLLATNPSITKPKGDTYTIKGKNSEDTIDHITNTSILAGDDEDKFAADADYSDMPVLLPADYESGAPPAPSPPPSFDLAGGDRVPMTELSEKEEDKPPTPPASTRMSSEMMDEGAVPPNDPEPPRRLSSIERHGSESENAASICERSSLFPISSSVDLSELAERLYTNIDAEQLRQLTTLIQSKAHAVASSNDRTCEEVLVTAPTETPKPAEADTDDSNIVASSSARTPNISDTPEPTLEDASPEITSSLGFATNKYETKHGIVSHANENTLCVKSNGGTGRTSRAAKVAASKSDITINAESSEAYNREKLMRYRLSVRALLNKKLHALIDSLDTNFAAMELRMPATKPNKYPVATWTRRGSVQWRDMEERVIKTGRPFFWMSQTQEKSKELQVEPKSTRGRGRRKNGIKNEEETNENKSASASNNAANVSKPLKDRREHGDVYTKIRTNIIVETPPTEARRHVPCNCGVEAACLSMTQCANRTAHVECIDARLCQLSSTQCKNRPFSALERSGGDSKLRVFAIAPPQFGVRTTEPLAKSQLACEYLGELISDAAYCKRMMKRATKIGRDAQLNNCFATRIQEGFVLDATRKGNIARFIRHSCKPNCKLQTWLVGSEKRVGVFALRNIFSSEELTVDFATDKVLPHDTRLLRCTCEAPNCTGFLGGNNIANKSTKPSNTPIVDEVKPVKCRKGRKRSVLPPSDQQDSINKSAKLSPAIEEEKRDTIGGKTWNPRNSGQTESTSSAAAAHNTKRAASRMTNGSIGKRFRRPNLSVSGSTRLFMRRNLCDVKKRQNVLALKRPFSRLLAARQNNSRTELVCVAQFLEKLFRDVAKFSIQNENVASKRVRQLFFQLRKNFTGEIVQDQDNGSTKRANTVGHCATILLEAFDALIMRWIDTIRNTCGNKCADAIGRHYATFKESLVSEFGRKRATEMSKEVAQCLATFGWRPRRGNSVNLTLASPGTGMTSKSPTPSSKRHSSDAASTVSSSGSQRVLAIEADLSYMDSMHLVGSYNPDHAVRLTVVDEDCVRCICGIMEDDGVMTQCDLCNFWLHSDCLDVEVTTDEEFVCDFCTRSLPWTPNVDIMLRPQPRIRFPGCAYYRTLVNSRGIQVRVNEAVYVKRLINDEHKQTLRALHEQCAGSNVNGIMTNDSFSTSSSTKKNSSPSKKASNFINSHTKKESPDDAENGKPKRKRRKMNNDIIVTNNIVSNTDSTVNAEAAPLLANRWHADAPTVASEVFERKDLRTFRVERIFTGPNGERFVFGVYYARPHETFCDSSRTFYRNELFWTPLFDTLPLDAVVGRCLILEPNIWAMGRPKSPKYLEEDVFICEYQIDRNQRSFEKISPKNRYSINTEPYVFDQFETKLTLKRDFTPFILYPSPSSANPSPAKGSTRNPNECLTIVVPSDDGGIAGDSCANQLRTPEILITPRPKVTQNYFTKLRADFVRTIDYKKQAVYDVVKHYVRRPTGLQTVFEAVVKGLNEQYG